MENSTIKICLRGTFFFFFLIILSSVIVYLAPDFGEETLATRFLTDCTVSVREFGQDKDNQDKKKKKKWFRCGSCGSLMSFCYAVGGIQPHVTTV